MGVRSPTRFLYETCKQLINVMYWRAAGIRILPVSFLFSGFHLTARTWFSRLDAPDRSDYHLLGVDRICALLRRAKLVASPDQIIHAIESRILARLEAGHLVFVTGRFYWIFRIETRRGAAYAVLDAYGSPVSPRVGVSLKRLDGSLKGKRLLNLQAMEKVLLALAESGQKTSSFYRAKPKNLWMNFGRSCKSFSMKDSSSQSQPVSRDGGVIAIP